MVGVKYLYSDRIFVFYWYIDLFSVFLIAVHWLVGCLSMIVWTHAVLGVL